MLQAREASAKAIVSLNTMYCIQDMEEQSRKIKPAKQKIQKSATKETSPKCCESLGVQGCWILTPALLHGLSPDSGC